MKTLLLTGCLLVALQLRANVVTLPFTALNQPVQEVYVSICDTLKVENTSGHSYMLWNDTVDFMSSNDPACYYPDSLTGFWGNGDGYFYDLYEIDDGKAYIYHQMSHVLFIIHILPYAQRTITETICEGGSYFFNNEELTENGFYSMQVSSGQECDSVIYLELSVVPPPPDSYFYAGICPGETYTFMGTTYDQAGVYPHYLTTPIGCDSVVYLSLTVSEQPPLYVFSAGGTTIYSSNWGPGYALSWYDCDVQAEIPGENGQFMVGSEGGQYAVISSYYGCVDTSECFTIQTVGTDELTHNGFTVAPNPASDAITVTFSEDLKAEEYALFQVDGKLISEGRLTAPSSVISLDEVPEGPYLLRINGHYQRLIKN